MTSSHSDECSVSSAAGRGGFVSELFLTAAVIETLRHGDARASQIARRTGVIAETDAAAAAIRGAVRHTLSRLERQGRVTYGYHGYQRFKTWKLATNTSEESDSE